MWVKHFCAKKIAKSHYFVQKRSEVVKWDLNSNQGNKILNGTKPRLIDEWQIDSQIWDFVRFKIDQANGKKGLYILTGSSSKAYKNVYHSGAGRFTWLEMQAKK